VGLRPRALCAPGRTVFEFANFMSSLRVMDLRDEELGEDDDACTMA
jgi:hypothetical protein